MLGYILFIAFILLSIFSKFTFLLVFQQKFHSAVQSLLNCIICCHVGKCSQITSFAAVSFANFYYWLLHTKCLQIILFNSQFLFDLTFSAIGKILFAAFYLSAYLVYFSLFYSKPLHKFQCLCGLISFCQARNIFRLCL